MKRGNFIPKPQDGLNIIIVGCGKVGSTLVEQLSKEGHDITIVDQDSAKLQEIANMYDVMGIHGNGASHSVQLEAGIEKADLFIAVTDSDELNLLCCVIAKQVGDDCATIARVRTPDYSVEMGYLRDKLGLTMIINPELEAAREASRILYLPTAVDLNSFAHGQAEIVKFKIPSGNILDGISISELRRTIYHDILVCAVERNGDVTIPGGTFTLMANDLVSFVASRRNIYAFLNKTGFNTKHVKNTLIVGGGRSAYYLSSLLIHMGIDVRIIEQDRKRCEELSILLPKAIIINGDGSDQDLLKEEGIETIESFVPLTGIDEENIMLTLHARQVSETKTVTKINRSNFKNVINGMDLGSVIYPRYITSEAIIAYVRAKKNSMDRSNIETLYHLFDNQAEAIEFLIDQESEVTNTPLMNLNLKENLLLSCIYRNGNVIIPGGQDCIRIGDSVMVVTTHTGFRDISDILAP